MSDFPDPKNTEGLKIEMGEPMAEQMNVLLSILRLNNQEITPQLCGGLLCLGTHLLEAGYIVGGERAGFRAVEVVEEFLRTKGQYEGKPLH